MSTTLGLTRLSYFIKLAILQSQTPLGKEEMKKASQILNTIQDNPDSIEFRTKVDHEALQLYDYLDIIKNPMDLGKIKENLANGVYQYLEDVMNDIQLVWDNCKIYNQELSWIYKQAEKNEKFFRRSLKNFLPFLQLKPLQKLIKNTNSEAYRFNQNQINEMMMSEEITYPEKLTFSNRVKYLTQERLGEVVKLIKEKNSEAIKQVDHLYRIIIFFQIEQNKVQIYIDSLSKEVFYEIQQKLDEWIPFSQNKQGLKKVKI